MRGRFGMRAALLLVVLAHHRATAALCLLSRLRVASTPARETATTPRWSRHARMLESPFELPYKVPEQPKPFADYEWDDDYPGTFKPGKRMENYDLDAVLEIWEGRDNPACLELPQDMQWQVPLGPPEDILSWLSRIGMLEEEVEVEEADVPVTQRGDSLLDDEFDLDEEDGPLEGAGDPNV